MDAIIALNPIFIVLALMMMYLIGGTVQVLNPTKNPKKRKKAKKKGKKRRTAKQKAASKRNIKKAQAARRKGKRRNPKKKKAKKKKSKKRKKAKKKGKKRKYKRKAKRRRTVTTTVTRTNKKRKKRRKNPRKRKYKRRRKRNPKGFKKVKSLFPPMKGKLTVADGAGAVTGVVAGAGASGLTKMVTGKPFAGVAVHGGVWIGGTLIFKNIKKLGKQKARNCFARGWFVADGIAFGVDAGVTIFKHFTDSPSSILGLEDIKDAKWADKIKTVFLTGLSNPEDIISKVKASLGDEYSDYHQKQNYGLVDESLADLVDELEGYGDLSDNEYAMIAEAEALSDDYLTTAQSAASEEFV